MGLNIVNYAISKTYTNESIEGISGVLAGKNAVIEKIEYDSGSHNVHFKWTADDGTVKRQIMIVDDGDNIYSFYPNTLYEVDDLVIYAGSLYRCTVKHRSGNILDISKFDAIISTDGSYSLHQDYSELPTTLKPSDRKIAYCMSDYEAYKAGFYFWNGNEWADALPEFIKHIIIDNGVLIYDGKEITTSESQNCKIVQTYSDINMSSDKDELYVVVNSETINNVTYYSGLYLHLANGSSAIYIDEKETIDIDFQNEYHSPIEC